MPVKLENNYTPPIDRGPLSAPLSTPTFGEAFRATFAYQYAPLIDRVEELGRFATREFDQSLDPFAQAAGYEEYLDELAVARDQEHLDFIKQNIDERLYEKDVLTRAGITSGGVLVASLIDPLNVVFALPVFGQLGLLAKGGMTVRQAALVSARGGFVTGMASEAVRAPFDKTATDNEVIENILATTFFGGAIGSIPAVARAGYNYAKNTKAKRDAEFVSRGSLKRDIDGFTIESGEAPVPRNKPVAPVKREPVNTFNDARLRALQSAEVSEPDNLSALQNRKKTVDAELAKLKELSPPNFAARARAAQERGVSELEFKKIIDEDTKRLIALSKQDAAEITKLKKELKSSRSARTKEINKLLKEQSAAAKRLIRDRALATKEFNKAQKQYDSDLQAYNRELSQRKGVVVDGKKITFDDDLLQLEFNQRKWVQPEVKGATPLRETDFLTPEEWGEFQVMREITRSQIKRVKGESEAAYTDTINKIALDRSRSGLELEDTPLTRSAAWKMLSTPSKRILDKGTNSMKVFVHRVVGVDHMSTINMANGQATQQSISRRAKTHIGKYVTHINAMRDLWAQDQLGRTATTRVFGYNTDNVVAKWQNAKTFEDWYSAVNQARLLRQAGQGFGKHDGTVSREFRAAMREVDSFFDDYKQELIDLKLIATPENLRDLNKRIDIDIEYYQNMQETRGLTAGQQKRLNSLKKQKEYYQGLIDNSIVENYTMPIYYNKTLLAADENARKRLVDTFEEHIKNNPITSFWDDKLQKFVEVDPRTRAEPRKIAEDAVASIMEESDQMLIAEMNGIPRGKHLRHRQIAIPEHKIMDFIITDPRVARSYSARVGKRIEWSRKYGKQSIDDVLDDFELEMRDAGYKEKDIVSLRADAAFEYERVMGEHVRDASRLDNQTARFIKETSGMAYLDAAALASVTDAANIVFERGLLNIWRGASNELDRGLLLKNRKLIPATGEATELSLGGVQQRIIADNIDGIEPTAVERIMNPLTRAYYNIPILGNGLGSLTYFFKVVDGSYRASDLMNLVVRMANNNINEADARYLLRHGISERDAKIMAQMPYEKGNNVLHPNIDKWSTKTEADRELIRKWNTAMNTGIGNTILHATSFDKPRVMDGVVYVRYRPWMKKIGFGESDIDTRASTKNIKLVRLESGLMTMPFQFYNFMLGATARITGGLADPMRRHRVTGAIALMGLGYVALQLKKENWWFDARSDTEIFQRVIDQSGIFGVYADLAYTATHVAVGSGLLSEKDSFLKPKYNPSFFDAISEPFGAGPGMIASWIKGAHAYLNGDTSLAAKEFQYNSPSFPIMGAAVDFFTDD